MAGIKRGELLVTANVYCCWVGIILCGNQLRDVSLPDAESHCNSLQSSHLSPTAFVGMHQLPPFFFSHCAPVHALICKACISSNSPFSFKLFCTSRCLFRRGIPSNVSLTIVSSSLAPHPSE